MGSVLGLGKVGLGLVWVWPGLAWIVGHGGVDSDWAWAWAAVWGWVGARFGSSVGLNRGWGWVG